MKNGVEVPTGVRSRYRVKCEGLKHFLVINDASREDTGSYSIMATGGTSEAHVQVDRTYSIPDFFLLLLPDVFARKIIRIDDVLHSVLHPRRRTLKLVKPLKVFQDLQDQKVLLGQPIKLQCEISPGNVPGRWYRNGQLIQPNDRINIVHRNRCVSGR